MKTVKRSTKKKGLQKSLIMCCFPHKADHDVNIRTCMDFYLPVKNDYDNKKFVYDNWSRELY